MPTLVTKRGSLRWRGNVQVQGVMRQKLFEDNSRKSERAAFLWEEETRKAVAEELAKTLTVCLTVLDWANAYLNQAHTRFSHKTYQEKRKAFSSVIKEVGPERPVAEIDAAMASKYLSRMARSRSGYSVNKDRKNLAAGWTWARQFLADFPQGQNPFGAVPKFPEERHDRYVPPEEDFWKVFELTEGQDRVMLTAFLHLAARRNELLGLIWADVDFNGNRVRLWTRKRKGGRECDWLPMTRDLRTSLLWWREQRLSMDTEDREHVFVSLDKTPFCEQYYGKPFTVRQQFMKRLCDRAGVERFGFHAIRHLTASILYAKGYSVADIQAILRHQNPNTTTRYLKSLGVEQVRNVLEDGLARPGKVVPLPNKKALGA